MLAIRAALLAAAALFFSGGCAAAQAATRADPDHVLSEADRSLYTKALTAGDRGDWIAARGLADQGHNEIARLLVTWRYLMDRNSGASFSEIDAFLHDHPGWPKRQTLFARAEHAIPPAMDARSVIAWFGDRKPLSGMGKVRLGEALMATGKADDGRALIRDAWIKDNFEPSEELAIIRDHNDILTPDVDRRRLDRLLWGDDLAAARRELNRVDPQTQRLAEVRMALKTAPKTGERMAAELPDTLRQDSGVIFDRAKAMRQAGDEDEIPDLLVRAPIRDMANIDSSQWWGDMRLAAREAMKAGDYKTAYRLISGTGLSEGTDFAEAEFMAGWIALRFLHDPNTALSHFQRLADGVSRPISRGRARYWSGRAYEEIGDAAQAAREYRLAAQDPETFYGQLALAKLSPTPKLRLRDTPADAARARRLYENDDLTAAIRVAADLGAEDLLRLFVAYDVESHPDAGYVALLAADLVRMRYPEVAVRAAKFASYDDIILLPYSHPVIALPQYAGPGAPPDPALVLGLIRQETEFNPNAESQVGAVGIMQVMPDTAKRVARQAGIAYHPAKLRNDPQYNVQLGMTELSGNLNKWDGSYVLAAAAYNAGATNVRRWIETYGDPRAAGVDPIDWIEQIPFAETRNYVQRVIENTEVYRNRLAGRSQPLQIMADIYRPKVPEVSVLRNVPPTPAATGIPVPQTRPDLGLVEPSRAPAGGSADESALASDPKLTMMDLVPRPDMRPEKTAKAKRPARRAAAHAHKKKRSHRRR